MSTSLAHIPLEHVSPSEYNLLTTALLVAEYGPTALSTYLTYTPSSTPYSNPTLQITLHPRPHFPSPLHASLLPHTTTPPPHLPHLPLSFPLNTLPTLKTLCNPYNLPITVPSNLLPLLNPFITPSPPTPQSPSYTQIIESLSPFPWSHLLPFQSQAVLRTILSLHGRVLIADDMGLGKTLQALTIAYYYQNHTPSPVLVLCPPSLRAAWASAIPKWLPIHPLTVHSITTAADFRRLARRHRLPARDPWDQVCDVRFVVMAYDLLHMLGEGALEEEWGARFDVVIADECHVLRNAASVRAHAAVRVLSRASRRVLVSGTPVLSRPLELYPFFSCLLSGEHGEFMSMKTFCERYCGEGRRVTYARELNALLALIMIRRAKAEVGACLPPKIRRRVCVDIAEHVLEPIRKMRTEVEDLEGKMRAGEGVHVRRRHNAICQALRFETAMAKVSGVVARVKQLLEDDVRKILVFAHHLNLLDAVENFAKRDKVAYVRMDGATSVKLRAGLVDSFQNDELVRLGVLSLATAGTGLTLTAADVVLFAELSWVPSELVQAEDRAHRIGRVGTVTVEYVVAPGTVDDLMWSTVKSKLSMMNETVDGEDKKRKEASDVSTESAKRLRISETDMRVVCADAIKASDDVEMRFHSKHDTREGRDQS